MMTDTLHLPDPDRQPEFYADIPTKRLLAWVIDTAVILAMCLVAVVFTLGIGLFIFPALYVVLGFAYRTATIARGSATWGMQVMAIEFRRPDGQLFDLPMAALHTLGYSLSIAVFPAQIASIVMMLSTPRAQGLTDHMLGTVAINRRAGPARR